MNVIYGLQCPESGLIRYIGKSMEPNKRLKAHIYSADRFGTYKQRWLASLLLKGLSPVLIVLEELQDSDCWKLAERRWIEKATYEGWPLTNLASGGEGSSPLTEEASQRKFEIMQRPETRKRMSDSAKARWADEEKKARALAGLKSDERRRKQSISAKRRVTPEYRAMQSARSKAAWSDPEKKRRILAGITPEVRLKVSEAAKRMWETSDNCNVMLANLRAGRGK